MLLANFAEIDMVKLKKIGNQEFCPRELRGMVTKINPGIRRDDCTLPSYFLSADTSRVEWSILQLQSQFDKYIRTTAYLIYFILLMVKHKTVALRDFVFEKGLVKYQYVQNQLASYRRLQLGLVVVCWVLFQCN